MRPTGPLTTKVPLVGILMELAALCHDRGIRLHLDWAPREQNVEADELAAGVFRRFDPNLRIPADISSLNFVVMHEMMQAGESWYAGLAESKASVKLAGDVHAPGTSKKPRVALEPW